MDKTIKLPARWDTFLKALTERLANPSKHLPSVRCLSRYALSKLFREIQRELCLPSTFPSGTKILDHLVDMGLAAPVPIDGTKENLPSKTFYLLGFRTSHEIDVDPLELLQAYKQKGVVCFFSALFYFGLTTQIPTHHHIATIVKQKERSISEISESIISKTIRDNKSDRRKLGSYVFSYQGVPFYSTKRKESTIPGIKLRVFNPRTQIRMTTIEQVLLDTLQYPNRCGGPEVIFDSWKAQINKIDTSLIVEYLKKIDLLSLERRLGAMFDLLDYRSDKDLFDLLKVAKDKVSKTNEMNIISLFKGLQYSNMNSTWKVLIP